MHTRKLEAAFQNWFGYFSVIKGPRFVLSYYSIISSLSQVAYCPRWLLKLYNHHGGILDRRRRKCRKATPLLLKETSRKFLTTHLAMLNLREAGKCSSSSEHIVIPSSIECMLLWRKEPFMFGSAANNVCYTEKVI